VSNNNTPLKAYGPTKRRWFGKYTIDTGLVGLKSAVAP
jgi:hypothetical protein